MTIRRNGNAALCLAKMLVAAGAIGLMLAACGGGAGVGDLGGGGAGGGDSGGGGAGGGDPGGPCAAGLSARTHPLACGTNGLPPGIGFLEGLWILETSPKDGAKDIAAKGVVRVTFNRTMATAPSVVVRDQGGREVAGAVAIDGESVVFTPGSPFAYLMTYSVVVDGGTSAYGDTACGFAMSAERCHIEFAFTTAASPT